MKRYSIYLKIDLTQNKSRTALFDAAKIKFLKAIEPTVASGKIVLATEQLTKEAVDLSVDEKHWEEIQALFVGIDEVATIDAEYLGGQE